MEKRDRREKLRQNVKGKEHDVSSSKESSDEYEEIDYGYSIIELPVQTMQPEAKEAASQVFEGQVDQTDLPRVQQRGGGGRNFTLDISHLQSGRNSFKSSMLGSLLSLSKYDVLVR